jgi:hypothetical protein
VDRIILLSFQDYDTIQAFRGYLSSRSGGDCQEKALIIFISSNLSIIVNIEYGLKESMQIKIV